MISNKTVLSRRTFFLGLKALAQARDHCGARDAIELLKGFYAGDGAGKKHINDSRVSTHRVCVGTRVVCMYM